MNHTQHFKIVLILMVLMASMSLTNAAEGDNSTVIDDVIIAPLTNAVTSGITGFIILMCDSIFSYFSEGGPDDVTFADPVSEGIYMIATYNMNPFDVDVVKTTAQTSAVFWFIGMLFFLLYGLVLLLTSKYLGGVASTIEYITHVNPVHSSQVYLKASLTGILLAFFFYAMCGIVLLMAEAATKMFMMAALPAIAPTPDNIILYVMVAFLYLVMLIFFAFRTIYLCLYVAFGLIVIILFIFSRITREIAIRLTIMFICFALLQPIVVAITTVGVLIIHELGFGIGATASNLFYSALLIILVLVALSLIFGTQRIRNMIGTATSATENIVKVVI